MCFSQRKDKGQMNSSLNGIHSVYIDTGNLLESNSLKRNASLLPAEEVIIFFKLIYNLNSFIIKCILTSTLLACLNHRLLFTNLNISRPLHLLSFHLFFAKFYFLIIFYILLSSLNLLFFLMSEFCFFLFYL